MAFDFTLERGKIREFAEAAGSNNEAYRRPEPTIPPTFLTSPLHFYGTEDDKPHEKLGFELARVLHAEEEFVFHGPPPRAGTTLTATSRLAEQYEKEGRRGGRMRFAVTLTEFRDPNGNLVVERRATAVETAQAPKEG